MTWLDRAACKGMGADTFAVGASTPPYAHKIVNALKVCARCPVRGECLDDMLGHPDPPFRIVIAGLTPVEARTRWFDTTHELRPPCGTERDELRPPCGTERGYGYHRRHGEETCRPCVDAATAARNRRNQQKETA